MPDFTPPNDWHEDPSQRPHQREVLPLSPTEKKVCALLLQRLTEPRIAEHMDRSQNTIHVHVRNIYRKLGIKKRSELYVYPGIITMILSKD